MWAFTQLLTCVLVSVGELTEEKTNAFQTFSHDLKQQNQNTVNKT